MTTPTEKPQGAGAVPPSGDDSNISLKERSIAKDLKCPPRVWIEEPYSLLIDSYICPEIDTKPGRQGAIEFLSLQEHQEILDQAVIKAEADVLERAYLNEVTYWICEHRAYVEAGMIWEAELAMKNSRRYGDLAKAASSPGSTEERK